MAVLLSSAMVCSVEFDDIFCSRGVLCLLLWSSDDRPETLSFRGGGGSACFPSEALPPVLPSGDRSSLRFRNSFVIVRSLAELRVDVTELRMRLRRMPPTLFSVMVLACDAKELRDGARDRTNSLASSLSLVL